MTAPLRCAVLDDYQQVAMSMADWSQLRQLLDVTVFGDPFSSEGDVVSALATFDVVVAMRERTPFPASTLKQLPQLRLLVTSGMHNASIDVQAAADRGVIVCGTASTSEPPAELTWALLLGLARHLVSESNGLRAGGPWQHTVGVDLAGRTLGLVGLGRLGSKVARVGQAFDMDVVAWSQHLSGERAAEVGVRRAASLNELMATSDFVSVHLVLSERSRGLIDAAALAAMKPSSYLINTARAAIVDQPALIDALQAGRIAGAGLDVFDIEPLPAGHPFRTLPTVLATPHLGYVTRANYEIYFREAIEDITAFLAGRPIRVLGAS